MAAASIGNPPCAIGGWPAWPPMPPAGVTGPHAGYPDDEADRIARCEAQVAGRRRRVLGLLAGALALAAAMVAGGAALIERRTGQVRLAGAPLRARLAADVAQADERNRLRAELMALREREAARRNQHARAATQAADLAAELTALSRSAPAALMLHALRQDGPALVVEGAAASQAALTTWLPALRRLGLQPVLVTAQAAGPGAPPSTAAAGPGAAMPGTAAQDLAGMTPDRHVGGSGAMRFSLRIAGLSLTEPDVGTP